VILPRAARPGARVALVAPAGPLSAGALERAIARVEALGWVPEVGVHAGGRRGYLSGSDEERLSDLQSALWSTENDAIWMLRGGYGTMRLLPRLDWRPLRDRPRPLVGFSDNTALLLAAGREGLVTFHGPHPAAPDLTGFSIELLGRMLGTPGAPGVLPDPEGATRAVPLVPGVAEGRLIGGNLAILAATMGTPYEARTAGAILFIEEIGEHAYRLDRLLTQLRLGGLLDGVAGIAIGGITDCPDGGADGIPPPSAVVEELLGRLHRPIATGFPFGHLPDSWTLPVGVRARLDATAGTLEILDPVVAS
jgi:muramoyltetrapeptide carboxypeptidase